MSFFIVQPEVRYDGNGRYGDELGREYHLAARLGLVARKLGICRFGLVLFCRLALGWRVACFMGA
jgi:hypothetical protein